jgi:hypothetical protein
MLNPCKEEGVEVGLTRFCLDMDKDEFSPNNALGGSRLTL